MFDWDENRLQEDMNSLLFTVFKLSRENTLPEDMCDIIFEKAKGNYTESVVQRVP